MRLTELNAKLCSSPYRDKEKFEFESTGLNRQDRAAKSIPKPIVYLPQAMWQNLTVGPLLPKPPIVDIKKIIPHLTV